MAFLIDTSALIHVLRDRTGLVGPRYDAIVRTDAIYLSRVTAFEILKGARSAIEWSGLEKLLAAQTILECDVTDWTESARLVFDLRRSGITLKNTIDALIAQAALKHSLTLVHDDQDFELIAQLRPLKLQRFRP